jgi:hypothetical protein
MNASRYLFLAFALAASVKAWAAQTLPTDIAVTLRGMPDSGLATGAQFTLVVTARNLGPQPVDTVVLQSTDFTNQFDFTHASIDCPGFVISVADTQTGSVQFMNWYVAAIPLGTAPFAVGETRTCTIALALSASAPATFPFTFAISHQFVDIDPTNDSSTVVLSRPAATIAATPTMSQWGMMVLITALIICATCFSPSPLMGEGLGRG